MSSVKLKKSIPSSVLSPVGDFIALFIADTGQLSIKDSNGLVTFIGGMTRKYSAKITQTITKLDSGVLEIGKEYVVPELQLGDDLTNVGYVSDGVPFTAIDTTPTTWTNNTEVFDILLSQPTEILVKENSIGTTTVEWYYDNSNSQFKLKFVTNGLYLEDLTFLPYPMSNNQNLIRIDDDTIEWAIGSSNLVKNDIEITLYNN